jgi:hypothetical protein
MAIGNFKIYHDNVFTFEWAKIQKSNRPELLNQFQYSNNVIVCKNAAVNKNYKSINLFVHYFELRPQ